MYFEKYRSNTSAMQEKIPDYRIQAIEDLKLKITWLNSDKKL